MNDNILNFDRDRHTEPHWGARADEPDDDYPYGEMGDGYYDSSSARALGDLLEVIVVNDQVIDVRKRSIQGTGYECAAMDLGRGRPVAPKVPPTPPAPARHEQTLTWLSLLVGGEEELTALDARALPSEELDLTGHRDDVRAQLASIDRELTRVTELILGAEVRTAARLLLVRAVVAQPALLRGVSGDEVMACAALTAVAKANDLVGQGRVVPVSLLRTLFNLRSAPNDKVSAMTRAVAPQTALLGGWERPLLDVPVLGSPDFLVGSFRQAVIAARDAALHLRATTPELARPVPD